MYAFLYQFIWILFNVLIFAIFARAILSWFSQGRTNRLMIILDEITEPIIAPIRRVVPRIGMLDISPIVAIILLQVIQTLLLQSLQGAAF
ncbi:MAG: YggT family protein [Dehalococcoidales bacterium]|nr:YggT family protein [Dehalococcoidales bacterium]